MSLEDDLGNLERHKQIRHLLLLPVIIEKLLTSEDQKLVDTLKLLSEINQYRITYPLILTFENTISEFSTKILK